MSTRKLRAEVAQTRAAIHSQELSRNRRRDTVRALVRRRKLTAEQREAADALMDQYRSALGDFAGTPLGQDGSPLPPRQPNAGDGGGDRPAKDDQHDYKITHGGYHPSPPLRASSRGRPIRAAHAR